MSFCLLLALRKNAGLRYFVIAVPPIIQSMNQIQEYAANTRVGQCLTKTAYDGVQKSNIVKDDDMNC